jgi:hypothetical protein
MNRILVSLLFTGVANLCHAQFRPDCSCSFQDLYKLKIKSITDSTFNLQTGEKYKTSEMIFDDHGRPKETLRFNRNGKLYKQAYTLWSTENKHQKVYNSIIYSYDQIQYDSKGSWISRKVTAEEDWDGHKGVYKFIETRKVEYWK